MARALATGPLLLLDEIAGGLTEGECLELVETISDIHAAGMTIVWIEHIVHALLAVVDRLIVLNFGKKIAEGEPREVMAPPRCGRSISVSRHDIRARNPWLTAFYGDFQALYGIDTEAAPGRNRRDHRRQRRGKVDLPQVHHRPHPGAADSVRVRRRAIGALPAAEYRQARIALVPEGRRLFPSLTVEENLLIGGYRPRRRGPWTLESIYALFPILRARAAAAPPRCPAASSRWLAIGRALMSNPRMLLCDEISLGLAPIVIRDIYAALPQIKAKGTSVVLVEQDICRP